MSAMLNINMVCGSLNELMCAQTVKIMSCRATQNSPGISLKGSCKGTWYATIDIWHTLHTCVQVSSFPSDTVNIVSIAMNERPITVFPILSHIMYVLSVKKHHARLCWHLNHHWRRSISWLSSLIENTSPVIGLFLRKIDCECFLVLSVPQFGFRMFLGELI